jgi:hypothetical protein
MILDGCDIMLPVDAWGYNLFPCSAVEESIGLIKLGDEELPTECELLFDVVDKVVL